MGELDVASTLIKVAATFALLWLTLRLVARFHGGGGRLARAVPGAGGRPVEIVARQTLGRAAQVVVARIGTRSYALGVTASHVQLLTELDEGTEDPGLEDLDEEVDVEVAGGLTSDRVVPTGRSFPGSSRTPNPVQSSSWRDLMESLRERTVRH